MHHTDRQRRGPVLTQALDQATVADRLASHVQRRLNEPVPLDGSGYERLSITEPNTRRRRESQRLALDQKLPRPGSAARRHAKQNAIVLLQILRRFRRPAPGEVVRTSANRQNLLVEGTRDEA
jgi:hypothetical protein